MGHATIAGVPMQKSPLVFLFFLLLFRVRTFQICCIIAVKIKAWDMAWLQNKACKFFVDYLSLTTKIKVMSKV